MRWGQWFFWGLAALLSTGCSHALSPGVRQQIDTTLSLTQLRTTPEAYKDAIVMLGGDILSTRNLTEGTLSKCAAGCRTDRLIGSTEGASWRFARGTLRFYSKGRQVTLAGRVLGTHRHGWGDHVRPPTGLLLSCHMRPNC